MHFLLHKSHAKDVIRPAFAEAPSKASETQVRSELETPATQLLFKKYAEDDNDNRHQEHQDRNPVHAVHVLYKLVVGPVWIRFFDVEILCNLSPKSHKNICDKISN
jgi:hypothetical protein